MNNNNSVYKKTFENVVWREKNLFSAIVFLKTFLMDVKRNATIKKVVEMGRNN